ncbi:hypothetical protein M1L60_33160 [Actinoplanes sp. TRM 88003]|uniref:Uncharacterized protein n=1 Tax=Paractinoplanes aksuensis TaxID=2939490 RepID=A0ABT1DXW9_9ACTN|nr:hypothetical protein [Actinoplanes aksuensis]MCO8275443.1 hypothetical protein [Actinoplanes aksuensis]
MAGSSYEDGKYRFRVADPGRRAAVAWYEPYDLDRMGAVVRSGFEHRADTQIDVLRDGFTVLRDLLTDADRNALFVDVHGDEVSKVNYVLYRGPKQLSMPGCPPSGRPGPEKITARRLII